MTPEAKASVDKLFAEPFEPEWMAHRKRIREELRAQQELEAQQDALFAALSFQRATGRLVDKAYRATAVASRARLISRCDGRGNYTNGIFVDLRKKWSRHPKRRRIAL